MIDERLETTCKICGHKYHVCEKCIKLKYYMTEPWRLHACSPMCNEIYNALKFYEQDNTKKQETIEIIEDRIKFYSGLGYDVKLDCSTLASELKPIYTSLYGESTTDDSATTEFTVLENIVDSVAGTQTVDETNTDSKNDYYTSAYGYKRKYKHK